MEQVVSLLVGYSCGLGVGVFVARLIMRRRLRAHSARVQAAWDYELANLRQVNLEADKLSKEVVASAKKFRETFGIEQLPAPGRFVARRPSGWN